MASNGRSQCGNPDGSSPAIREPFGLSPRDLIENVANHWRIFVSVLVACLLTASIYAICVTPTYSTDALVRVEEKKGTAFGSLSTVAKALDIEDSPVSGEIDILLSRTVITEAITATAGDTLISVKNTFPIIGPALTSLFRRRPDGLSAEPFKTPFFAWGGENVVLASFDVPPDEVGKPQEFYYKGDGKYVLEDRDGLPILSGIVGVPVAAGDYKVLVRQIIARPGTRFQLVKYPLQTRIEQILKRLSASETKRQSGIIRLVYEDSNPVYAARFLNALVEAYIANNVKRRSLESEKSLQFLELQLPVLKDHLQSTEEKLNAFRNKERTVDLAGEVRNLLDESAMVEQSEIETRQSYEELRAKFAPAHPLVVAANAKLNQLDIQAKALRERIGQLPAVQQQYLRLARDVEVTNQLYVALLNNAQQLRVAKAGTVGNASIVDYAAVSLKPVKPRRMVVGAAGGVIGLILAFVSTQAIALTLGRVRDPRKLEEIVGVQTLGILPQSPRQQAEIHRAFLICREGLDSAFVEAMEGLVLALQFCLASKKEGKVVLITSAIPGQGKSLVAANLAYLLAERGLRTLLLDADMRQSTIHRYVRLREDNGLSGILRGSSHPRDAILKASEYLHALPAGPKPAKVSGLFVDNLLRPFIATLKQEYDVILVDSPPVIPVPDATALSKHADATLFIARQGAVSYSEVTEAIARLGKVGSRVDGIVFNGYVPSPLRHEYYSKAYRGRHYLSKKRVV